MRPIVVLLGLILTIASDLISPKGAYARVPQENCELVTSPTAVLIGEASYYGPGFHGKRTATGNIYDQNDPHKAACLKPFTHTLREQGKLTCVQVTNLENGRRLEVECRDTGAFCQLYDRMIDLSKAGSAFLRGGKPATIERVLVKPVPCSRKRRDPA